VCLASFIQHNCFEFIHTLIYIYIHLSVRIYAGSEILPWQPSKLSFHRFWQKTWDFESEIRDSWKLVPRATCLHQFAEPLVSHRSSEDSRWCCAHARFALEKRNTELEDLPFIKVYAVSERSLLFVIILELSFTIVRKQTMDLGLWNFRFSDFAYCQFWYKFYEIKDTL
jgi:hypothetical protein